VTRIETDHRQAFGRERCPKPSGQWSRLETDAHRSRSIPTHCCSDRSSVSRASATPNPIARFIKHVKLRLFQRYIEPDILRHWLLSGCCVATTKLYPSRNKSSVIGPRDYHHVSQIAACRAAAIRRLFPGRSLRLSKSDAFTCPVFINELDSRSFKRLPNGS